ncbi:MAG: rod-binding protein [Thermodesulfobacteriota bacterium]
MATSPIDSAQARAATEAAELQSQKRSLEALRQKLNAGPGADKKLRQACEGFESIFLNKIWAQMRKTVPKEGYLHSKEEEAYLSMFDQELMKKMSSAGGIGLGKMLYENLSDHLAKASAGTAARAAGRNEVGPLHPEPMGLPLNPEPAQFVLRPEDRRDAASRQQGIPLAPADAARLGGRQASAPASPAGQAPAEGAGVILPPGFHGPDPTPPQGPEDLAALNRAMELARRVEGGVSAHRAVRAYRDAARDESAVSLGESAQSYVTPPFGETGDEEPGI